MKEVKKRISAKMLKNYINSIAKFEEWDSGYGEGVMVYKSLVDGSYLGMEGLENDFKWMIRKGITEQVTSQMGYNPITKKWYGWSHRAVYGFGIGSMVKKGDCGYTASTVDALFDSVTKSDEDGWVWQKSENVRKLKGGIEITIPMVNLTTAEGEEACDTVVGANKGTLEVSDEPAEPELHIIKVGRGEWVAKNLEDAKQMAADFAESVS